jgi:hAT family C-terminal dimerisation region
VFAVPTSSASSERVWSVFSLIHTKKRCRLKNETVNKLAYVYINCQLVVEKNDEDANIDYFLQQFNEEEFACIEDDDLDV